MSTKKARQDRKDQIRGLSAWFPRLIEWSEEDGCFVGSAPPLVGQCCHGKTEADVATQLSTIVGDLMQDVLDGKMLAPKVESGKRVRFDALVGRLAQAYAAVPAQEGLAEIDRITAKVRSASRSKSARTRKG
jgi:predicted RNase H-like HicB family nuclease